MNRENMMYTYHASSDQCARWTRHHTRKTPEVKQLAEIIVKMDADIVMVQLDLKQCSIAGSDEVIRNRLLRMSARMVLDIVVPWNVEWDERGDRPPETVAALLMMSSYEGVPAPRQSQVVPKRQYRQVQMSQKHAQAGAGTRIDTTEDRHRDAEQEPRIEEILPGGSLATLVSTRPVVTTAVAGPSRDITLPPIFTTHGGRMAARVNEGLIAMCQGHLPNAPRGQQQHQDDRPPQGRSQNRENSPPPPPGQTQSTTTSQNSVPPPKVTAASSSASPSTGTGTNPTPAPSQNAPGQGTNAQYTRPISGPSDSRRQPPLREQGIPPTSATPAQRHHPAEPQFQENYADSIDDLSQIGNASDSSEQIRIERQRRRILDVVSQNMLPEYVDVMEDKGIDLFETMEALGRRVEREVDLKKRYKPPPPPDRARIPGSGNFGKSRTKKAAEIAEHTDPPAPAEVASASVASTGGKKKKGRGSEKKEQSPSSKAAPAEELAAMQGVQGQAPANAPRPRQNKQPASTSVNAPPIAIQAASNQQSNRTNMQQPWQPPPNQPWNNQQDFSPPQTQYPPQNWTGNQERRDRQKATGASFEGDEAGHCIAHCPGRSCYYCQGTGHTSGRCPNRKPPEICQVCHTPNTTSQHCPTCAPFRAMLGNAQQGGQNPNLSPQANFQQ